VSRGPTRFPSAANNTRTASVIRVRITIPADACVHARWVQLTDGARARIARCNPVEAAAFRMHARSHGCICECGAARRREEGGGRGGWQGCLTASRILCERLQTRMADQCFIDIAADAAHRCTSRLEASARIYCACFLPFAAGFMD